MLTIFLVTCSHERISIDYFVLLSLGVNRFVPGYQIQLSRQIKSTKKHIHKHGNARHKQNSTDAQAVQRMLTYLKLAVA